MKVRIFFLGHVIGCFCSAIIFLVCVVIALELVEVAITLFGEAN